MKRSVIIIFIVLISIALHAQDQKEKQDSLVSVETACYLPQKGDVGFGIDAVQIFNFVGNMFSQAGTNTMNFYLPANSQTFYFKYIKDPKTYYRVKLRAGHSTINNKEYIMQTGQTDPGVNVEDSYRQIQSNFELYAGIEKRKGINRLQGFYGLECGFVLMKQKEVYNYGNAVSQNDPVPFITTNFGDNIDFSTNPDGYTMRLLEHDHGNGTGLNLGLIFGAEYFFAKKISVAGEFGWYIFYNITGKGYTEYEYWHGTDNYLGYYKTKTLGGTAFVFDNTPSGMLTLNVYF